MLNILCALHCEAKPLIQHLRLRKLQESAPFPVYENEAMRLAVCGIGKIAAATATGWLGARENTCSAWLNIGVAGHADLPIGYQALALSVTDAGSSKRFYPDISLIKGLPMHGVTTVDKPSFSYPDKDLVDMEAAGFYQAAQRFATVDRIHCLKIVSDNAWHPTEKINKEFVRDLIGQSITKIESLIGQILALIPNPPAIDDSPYVALCHWTETEKHQLERLLIRWKAMEKSPPLCQHLKTSREIIQFLEHTLNQLPLCFTPSTTKKK
ncbi:putative uncharacterized protein [Waddlia chondrophila 2032/99]|uniref:Nucleoside phosphorylase domain-containing protein n=2 Tax=Waddlia chondrophila TaxID=71667 RepID=D6YTR3_WADCW|nr:hypothetical protein [Waddlia chondrophila]ADI37524.1 conserved hypothetical protein [Waddlia chondrophila WSU 86-1044]CCB90459.1 putative uncharacterized protein [Waddlia chondrophila 2032/99]